jgi:hypothetical protein
MLILAAVGVIAMLGTKIGRAISAGLLVLVLVLAASGAFSPSDPCRDDPTACMGSTPAGLWRR